MSDRVTPVLRLSPAFFDKRQSSVLTPLSPPIDSGASMTSPAMRTRLSVKLNSVFSPSVRSPDSTRSRDTTVASSSSTLMLALCPALYSLAVESWSATVTMPFTSSVESSTVDTV